MSADKPTPLSERAEEVLRAGGALPEVSDAVHARVWAGVEGGLVAAAPAGAAAGAAAATVSARMAAGIGVLGFLVGSIVGAGLYAGLGDTSDTHPDSVEPGAPSSAGDADASGANNIPSMPEVLEEDVLPDLLPPPAEGPHPEVAVTKAPSPVASRTAPATTTLGREELIIAAARGTLARAHPEQTLRQLERHARAFPDGQLAEERDSLWVQALVRLRRYDEARAKGAQFRVRYPQSLLWPSVEAALRVMPEPQDPESESRP